MPDINESLFIRALKLKPVPRTPVWFMRQAGRYLPEYREVRAKAGSFLKLCKNPELACEVTLQPLRRFPLDAAILFSDILTIPDAMGLGLYFAEGEGPCFAEPLTSIKAIEQLKIPEPEEDLSYVLDAAKLIRQEMPTDLPLIGFAGSPWTLACYMVEGRAEREFKAMFNLLYNEPKAAHLLLEKLAQSVAIYLEHQVRAGANALMIFDSWGGLLTPHGYEQFSLGYMEKIVNHLKKVCPEIPLILFTKGGGQWLKKIAATGCDALGLDWTVDLNFARSTLGDRVALQGNLHPTVLLAKPKVIQQEVKSALAAFGHGSGHVFNLGHGITPDVLPEHVSVMLEAVHEYSPAYHGN